MYVCYNECTEKTIGLSRTRGSVSPRASKDRLCSRTCELSLGIGLTRSRTDALLEPAKDEATAQIVGLLSG